MNKQVVLLAIAVVCIIGFMAVNLAVPRMSPRLPSPQGPTATSVGETVTSIATITPILTPPTEWIITPGPGTATPYVFETPEQVLDYVTSLFSPPLTPSLSYIKRASLRDIVLLEAGPEATLVVTPDATMYPMLPQGTLAPGMEYWVIGIQAGRDISEEELSTVMGMQDIAQDGPFVDPFSGTEFYMELDDVGNIITGGLLNRRVDEYTVEPRGQITLSSIESMPSASTQAATITRTWSLTPTLTPAPTRSPTPPRTPCFTPGC